MKHPLDDIYMQLNRLRFSKESKHEDASTEKSLIAGIERQLEKTHFFCERCPGWKDLEELGFIDDDGSGLCESCNEQLGFEAMDHANDLEHDYRISTKGD